MELKKIVDKVYYLNAPANLGLLVNEHNYALLIDAGLDESIARKIYRQLENSNLQLKGIIVTHAHADHFGGASFLHKKTSAKIYTSPMEATVIEHPLWEPIYLFGGAHPPLTLQNKFLLAPPSPVAEVLAFGPQNIEGIELEIVPLPGHSWQQIGVSCQGVLFCADAVFAPEVLKKHGIPLFCHLQETWNTFRYLLGRSEKYFLPAHGSLTEDINSLVEANRKHLEEVLNYILEFLKEPQTTEKILADCCQNWGVTLANQGQYYLMQATILAYLSFLANEGQLTVFYQHNLQYWQKV